MYGQGSSQYPFSIPSPKLQYHSKPSTTYKDTPAHTVGSWGIAKLSEHNVSRPRKPRYGILWL